MAGFFGTDYFVRQAEMMQSAATDEEINYQLQMLYLPRDYVQRVAVPKLYQAPLSSQHACASSSTRSREVRYAGSFELDVTEAEENFLSALGINLKPGIPEKKCGLCTRTKPLTEFIRTKDCAHEYCTECCKTHAEVKISLSKTSQIKCPHSSCRHNFDVDQCSTLLSQKSFDILNLRLTEAATPASQRVYCPFPDCSVFIPPLKSGSSNSANDTFVECCSCHRGFCLECNVPWERECDICADTVVHNEFISAKDCAHEYCTECCKRHAEVKILSGTSQIDCPHPDCRHNFDIEQCSTLLSPANFDILNTRLTEGAIPAGQKVFCPFQDCSVMMEKSESSSSARDTFAECYSCYRGFCLECSVPWHANMTCGEYRADIENAKQSGDEKLRELAKEKKWRECPNLSCRLMVERKSGCNHITCRCNYEFCYIDGAPWINKKATCSCPLWNNEADVIYPMPRAR